MTLLFQSLFLNQYKANCLTNLSSSQKLKSDLFPDTKAAPKISLRNIPHTRTAYALALPCLISTRLHSLSAPTFQSTRNSFIPESLCG